MSRHASEIECAQAGLLEGLDEAPARRARVELLAELSRAGVSIEELRRAVVEGRLAWLPSEREIAGELRYSSQQLADEAGVGLELLTAQRRASGLPSIDPGERAFGDEDLRAARAFRRYLDAGLPPEGLLESTRIFGQAAARSAAAARTLLGESLLKPGDTERDLALRFAAAARELHADTADTLAYLYRAHLLHQIRTDIADQADLATGELSATHEVTICFADLVGFTRIGERTGPDELGRLADRLAAMAVDLAEPPVRLVKTIGDAAMLVSPEPRPMLEAATALIDGVDQDDQLSQLRVGLAHGAALRRFGDWYGAPVNLANRVMAIARPGSILATRPVRDACREHYRWSRAGTPKLKGIKRPVALYRCRWRP